MGIWESVGKVLNKLYESIPDIVEKMEKLQSEAERKMEEYEKEVEKYKSQYSLLSDHELLQKMNQIRNDNTMKHRKAKYNACRALFDERGYEIGDDNKIRRKN